MFYKSILLALAALSISAGAAQAQSASVQDLRCAIVMLYLIDEETDDAEAAARNRDMAQIVGFFYFGRVQGRSPRFGEAELDREDRAVQALSTTEQMKLQIECVKAFDKATKVFGF